VPFVVWVSAMGFVVVAAGGCCGGRSRHERRQSTGTGACSDASPVRRRADPVFAVVLLPVAYAAFPPVPHPSPRIASVEPAQLTYVEDRAAGGTELSGKLKVRGHRAADPCCARSSAVGRRSPSSSENPSSPNVLFADLPVGEHYLVLYDGVQEVAR